MFVCPNSLIHMSKFLSGKCSLYKHNVTKFGLRTFKEHNFMLKYAIRLKFLHPITWLQSTVT